MEACLARPADRGPLLLTLGAAGATVLAVLAVVGIPALDACRGDDRGIVGCLRGIVDDKFDLGLEPRPATTPVIAQPQPATVAETTAAATPQLQVAEAPAVRSTIEPTWSLGAPDADKPPPSVAPPPPTVAGSPVEGASEAPPAVVQTADAEQADAPPAPETAVQAEVVQPAAPSFVPPLPMITLDGVPPDLQAATALPDAAPRSEPAPAFALPAPEPPTAPMPGLVTAAEPAVTATADAPALPAPDAPALPAPEAPGLAAPAQPVEELPPAFVLSTVPGPPVIPPPDLTVAAIDPVVPETPAPLPAPVLTPTIDAVEIDGDGNFIAGNGPAGATMRLYVDGLPAGISPVEGGRWLVEGTDLLTEPRQTLRVEALDAVTGKVIGEAIVEFERPVEPVAGEPDAPLVEQPAAGEALPPAERPGPLTSAVEPQAVSNEPAEAPAAVELPAAIAGQPDPGIVEITPVVPVVESPSVTILRPPVTPDITTLTTGRPSDGAVVTLGALPKSPAIRAHFTLPALEVAADVTVLHAIPIGDPGAGRFVSGKAIIRRGDTLWDIADRYYGHGIRYRTILRANRELIGRPSRIYPGQVFDLPLVYDD